jgi:ABC-type sugar transport system permease subunit
MTNKMRKILGWILITPFLIVLSAIVIWGMMVIFNNSSINGNYDMFCFGIGSFVFIRQIRRQNELAICRNGKC